MKTCRVCGGTATELLLFKSKYKESVVELCDEDFQKCRDLFNSFILGDRYATDSDLHQRTDHEGRSEQPLAPEPGGDGAPA